MPWKRIKKHAYYYRSVRVGGKVRSEYVGGGPFAELIARADALFRKQEAFERGRRLDERRERRQERREQLADLDAWCRAVERVADLAMRAAGYHKHARGNWREVREMKAIESSKGKRAKPADRGIIPGKDMTWKQIVALGERIEKGDDSRANLLQLREVLRAELKGERTPVLITTAGSPPHWVAYQLPKQFPEEKQALVREALAVEMGRIRRELAGENPTPLERLLVERIVTCWAVAHSFETGALVNPRDRAYHAAATAAQRRFLAAVKTLATIRQMALPVLLNVTAQAAQINVGNAPAPSPQPERQS